MELQTLIEAALGDAMAKPMPDAPTRELHAARSRAWMDALAARFEAEFPRQRNFEVFWRGRTEGRGADLGRSEMLHDLLVCEVAETPSARQATNLWYIRRAVWQIESEFARDSREAMNDFAKLVLGSAAHKLFVGPQVADNEAFVKALLPAARCCVGEVWVALIPHPDSWSPAKPKIDLWMLSGEWQGK